MIKTDSKYKSKRTFSWVSPKVEVKDTQKYGIGAFAGEDIKKGQFIHTLSGERVSLQECWDRINKEDEALTDPLQIALEEYIDLDEFSRTFNHSCDANMGLKNESDLFALRDIKKGEELTFDYSTTVGPNIPKTEWYMDCSCGSKKCRKIISNVLTIPKKELDSYIKEGFLQDYILKELAKIQI